MVLLLILLNYLPTYFTLGTVPIALYCMRRDLSRLYNLFAVWTKHGLFFTFAIFFFRFFAFGFPTDLTDSAALALCVCKRVKNRTAYLSCLTRWLFEVFPQS